MLECVPNFSAGRDPEIVASIVEAIATTPGVWLLGHESDVDHNRAVVTFAGELPSIVEAAVRAVERAAERIDLNSHDGVHPRLGAADVIPFVPLQGSTMADAVQAAHAAGAKIWSRLGIPVYFYEHAASSSERRPLQRMRRRGFEQLREDHAAHPADLGEAPHPTAGATLVGARDFLVAYNIVLDSNDLAIARRIAAAIRESSGGFPFVKALGLYLPSSDRVQVSMNLTNFAAIPLADVYTAVESRAGIEGTSIFENELIGFVPQRAFDLAPEIYRRCRDFSDQRILERRLATVMAADGPRKTSP